MSHGFEQLTRIQGKKGTPESLTGRRFPKQSTRSYCSIPATGLGLKVARLMEINDLRVATRAVVEAARESLVIGAG